ncbi:unnamed protein product [Trichogramma brassicae]|uniref:RING-type E3 ubiquitin transferase n=1 Tax=Trichogramma brassicae TaxID=86971 RepID=A0A6H5IT03_9HYME|nr:unnamed protein product [Trichogramma brassicae]
MNQPKKNNLRPASQAEILRAHQRDNDFISQMSESMTDLLHRYNLQRRFFCYFKSEIPAKLLYFIITSGLGNQTLGEEYTGIVQANLNNRTIPSLMVYGPRPHSSVSWGLRILGCVTIAQCLFHLWQSKNSIDDIVIHEKELDGTISTNCQLCLEKIPNATTPCGHLFCWTCLSEWVRARNRCPLCRESVTSSRIIPLMNM